jgi:hypothetical protein
MAVVINGDTGISPVTASGTSASVDGMTVGRGGGEVSTNTAVGASALSTNSAGAYITAIGYQALLLSTGNYNTAVGGLALSANTSGIENVAVGLSTMLTNTTGTYNVATGNSALRLNTTGSFNTAFGSQALYSNTTASQNTAVGYQAGYSGTTGTSYSTFVGWQSAYYQTGAQNDAFGVRALYGSAGASGTLNSAFGSNALNANTSGNVNTAVGQYALLSNTTGSNNTSVGYNALQANTTSSYNTSLGWQAGYSITTGGSNLCLGAGSGAVVTTGINNVYLGYTGASATGASSELVIAASNTNITGKGTNTGLIVAYNSGYGSIYQGNNGASWAIISDQRLKKNIVDNTDGLDKITQIQVRNFEYRLPEEITELPQDQAIQKQGIQLGAIAQELKEILPDCVKTESTGVMTVNTDNLTWYLINAVKELTARIKQLEGNCHE